MSKQIVQEAKIKVPGQFVKELSKKHNTSLVNVRSALRYFNNSELAEAIRKDAKELLQNEANKIQ